MNKLRNAAIVFLVSGVLAGPAAARVSTCADIKGELAMADKNIATLEGYVQDSLARHNKAEADVATLQARRRELRCIDNPIDRAIQQSCRDIDKYYVAYSRARDEWMRRMNAYSVKLEQTRLQRNQLARRSNAQCACWTAGVARTGMTGRNIAGYRLSSLADCKNKCDNTRGCLSIDYNSTDGQCFLNDLDTRSTSPTPRFTSRPDWPFAYYEHCSG